MIEDKHVVTDQIDDSPEGARQRMVELRQSAVRLGKRYRHHRAE